MKNNYHDIRIRLNDEAFEAIKIISEAEYRTVSKTAEMALVKYIKSRISAGIPPKEEVPKIVPPSGNFAVRRTQ